MSNKENEQSKSPVGAWLHKISSKIKRIDITTRISLFSVFLFVLIGAISSAVIIATTNAFIEDKIQSTMTAKSNALLDIVSSSSNTEEGFETKAEMVLNLGAINGVFDNIESTLYVIGPKGEVRKSVGRQFAADFDIPDSHASSFDFRAPYDIKLESQKIEQEMLRLQQLPDKLKSDKLTIAFIPDYYKIGTSKFFAKGIYYSAVALTPQNQKEHIFAVLIYNPISDYRLLTNLFAGMIFTAVSGIGILMIFTRIFVKSSLKPLRDLSTQTQKIDISQPGTRVLPGSEISDDEIGVLLGSLNKMLEKIENSYHKERQFTSDASHELRIPLTIILGNIELLKKFPDNPEIAAESLETIGAEAKSMHRLIANLLTLSRLENRPGRTVLADLNLREWIESVARQSRELYSGHVFYLELCSPANYSCRTNKEMLTQLIRIVIENAVKYSPAGSTVTLKLQRCKISVIDQGEGIPAEKLSFVKRRFYRVSEDRNRRTGGAGLGLSIAESLAKKLSCEFTIQSAAGRGTTASLQLSELPDEDCGQKNNSHNNLHNSS